MPSASALPHPAEATATRRVLFEIEAPDASNVFLAVSKLFHKCRLSARSLATTKYPLQGSFLNWEAALVCRHMGNGRFGVWVDLPKGKYEFKYANCVVFTNIEPMG